MSKKKFKKLLSFSEYFEIPKDKVDSLGFFDITLSLDSDLYIDSKLLTDDNSPYFLNAASTLKKKFSDIVRLLKAAKVNNDSNIYWKQAQKLLTFKEMHGLCLGYGTKDIFGNGVGKKIRDKIMNNLWTLIQDGREDPELLDLVCVFTEKFGCDRASDLIAYFIRDIIYKYNNEIIRELNLEKYPMIDVQRGKFKLLQNPIRKTLPILLLPKNILSSLPVCFEFVGIEEAIQENEDARVNLNSYIPFGEALSKKDVLDLLLSNREVYDLLIEAFKKADGKHYDFDRDPKCVWSARDIITKAYNDNPNVFEDASGIDKNNVESVVNKCIDVFKHLVEDCGLRDSVRKYDEKVSQHLFLATSYILCELYDVAVCPEMNSGRGPVDFFFTNGTTKISVELKKISNGQYVHGLESQLPDYMKSNSSQKGVYLVLNDVSKDTKKVKKLIEIHNGFEREKKESINLTFIDAFEIASASVIKN